MNRLARSSSQILSFDPFRPNHHCEFYHEKEFRIPFIWKSILKIITTTRFLKNLASLKNIYHRFITVQIFSLTFFLLVDIHIYFTKTWNSEHIILINIFLEEK